MEKFFCGYDPGSSNSGIAFYSSEGNYFTTESFDTSEIRSLILEYKPVLAVVEKVWIMPKTSAKASTSFMTAFGKIKGILEVLDVPYQEIPPKEWAKIVGLKIPSGKDLTPYQKKKLQKEYKLKEARKRFPLADLSKTSDIDKAESLWIALCAYYIFMGKA